MSRAPLGVATDAAISSRVSPRALLRIAGLGFILS
jgi:hypothetical protein